MRVQVWTYLVPNVVEANKRLRESGIPVVFDPVAITTAYLGDHKAMAIRAPDGTHHRAGGDRGAVAADPQPRLQHFARDS